MNNSTCEGGECGIAVGPTPLLVLPVILSVLWVLFDLFYASIILGFLVNKIANLFLKESGIHVGAIRISLLTGRVLFKDVHYYCRDYSFRVTDGYAVLRWWRRRGQNACSGWCCGNGGSESELQKRLALVFFQLNGFEFHWYNRSEVYDEWGKPKAANNSDSDSDSEESGLWNLWKELQPSFHFNFRKGRLVFGNHFVERSLVVYFDKAEAHYSTTEASNPYDELMHVVKWHGLNACMVLEPSPGYDGPIEEDPPLVSEVVENAYPVLKTDSAVCTYFLDSPGLVPLGETRGPKFAFDVVLGANTVVNYGCYANRQRTQLQKFFFPNDYVEHPVTEHPQPGEKRIYTNFDVSVQLSSPATFNVFFRDKESLQHISLELGAGSIIKVDQPWATEQEGYTSVVSGKLGDVRASTSLDYHPIARAENIELKTNLQFPRVWNATQTWDMKFVASQIQVNILFAYIDFVNAFLDDWVGEDPSDLLHFYPIDWNIAINLRQYEIFLFTNRYNWVDIDGTENTRLAFCGTTGQLTLAFPFTEFLPLEQKIAFTANGKNIVVRHYSPPSCSTRESLFALSSSNKHRWRVLEFKEEPKQQKEDKHPGDKSTTWSACSTPSVRSKLDFSILTLDSDKDRDRESSGAATPKFGRTPGTKLLAGDGASVSASHEEQLQQADVPDTQPDKSTDHESFPMGYCGETKHESGWLDIACGPSISISITYYGHNHDDRPGKYVRQMPSVLKIDIDVPTVLLRVLGCLARDLLALKENYPGEYINFTVFNSNVPSHSTPPANDPKLPMTMEPPSCPPNLPDEPKERFLDVVVDFKLCNITAEFPTHLPEGYPRDFPLPTACTSLFSVYVVYVSNETTVRLHVDPLTVQVPSMSIPPGGNSAYELGHVACSGIDLNCHGFTEFMCQERVEYAWLMQLLVGRITGAVSSEQLLQVVDWFHAAFIHTASHGDGFVEAPNVELIEPKVEPLSEEIKYRLFDLSILEADIHLLEGDAITRIQSPGFDLDLCSLHSNAETFGLSLQLQGLTATSYTPSSSMPNLGCLLECGLLDIGNIQGDLSLREIKECVPQRQLEFLKKADHKSRRLWFLWREVEEQEGEVVLRDEFRCGCCGGCVFLDGCVERQPPRVKLDSTVYTAQLSHSNSTKMETSTLPGTLSRSLALQSLKKALPTLGVTEIECVSRIHQGLLDHYDQKYPKPVIIGDILVSNAQETLDTSRPISVISDSTFVSARSSLTSLVEDDKFLSMENIDKAGLYNLSAGLSLGDGRKSKHKKKGSEFKSVAGGGAEEGGMESVDALLFTDPLAPYWDLVASQIYKPTLLHVPLKKKKQPENETKPTLESLQLPLKHQKFIDRGASLVTQVEIHREAKPAESQPSEAIPKAFARGYPPEAVPWPQAPTGGQPPGAVPQPPVSTLRRPRNALRLLVPDMLPLSPGCVPAVVQKETGRSTERRRRKWLKGEGDSGPDEAKMAMFSLSIAVNGSLALTISPPLLGFVERVTRNIGSFFEHQSALAILDVLSNNSRGAVQSHISKILKQKSFNPPPADSQPPLLHLSASMAPSSFAAIQLLQASTKAPTLPPFSELPCNSLKQIISNSSLVTLYLSGLSCKALLLAASELQQPTHPNQSNSPHHSEANSINGSTSGKAKSRTLLNSFKVSADLKCPVFQIAVCALIPVGSEDTISQDTLPGLSPAQSQLKFNLALPDRVGGDEGEKKDVTICNLLELGVRDASATCVAQIIHSEISEEAVLTWTNVQGYHLSDPTSRPKTDDFETKSNKVIVKISLPSLWSQLAAPHTGIPNSSTGGLDILTLSEAIDAWKPGMESLVDSAKMVLKVKTMREKRVALALLGNAAMCALCHKPSNSVHSEVSTTLRQTVVYSCTHHLWRTFPAFSEQLLPNLPIDSFYDEEILATTLALASRLFSIQKKESKKRLKSMMEPSESTACTSCGPKRPKPLDPDSDSIATVGYISISPSPSELAMPNAAPTAGQNLEAVDYGALFNEVKFGSVVVVRESLLPFFVMVGVSVDPQLRLVCHNSAKYFADFTVELREAAIFVAESASSASIQPAITVQYSSNPVLLAEQLAVNGRLKYSSESSLQRSPHLSLLARSSRTAEVLQQSTTSKLNISSNCCVSLDSITTNVTLPLLKLGRHMIETRKLRSSWRNKFRRETPEPEDIVMSKAPNLVPPQPPTVWPTDGDMPDLGEVPAQPQVVNIWEFSQSLVQQLSQLEQENIPQLTESLQKVEPRAESEPLSNQPAPSSSPISSKPIRISSYPHSPRYPRAHMSPPSAGKSPTSKVLFQVAPTVDPPSDSSESGVGAPGKQLDRGHKRALSSTSNVSAMSGEAVAVCIEDTDSQVPPEGVFLMSPDEQAAALDTYGGDVEDTTDSQHVMSSDEVVSSTPTHRTFIDPSVLARSDLGIMRSAIVPGMGDHTYPLVKSLKLTETELLFTVFGLLKINRIHFDLQVETTKASLELFGISASVDTRKAATTSQSITSMVGSLPQMDSQSTAEEGASQTQSTSEVLPTYLSIAATLKKSCLRVNDRGLPDSDLVLFSALPIYCSLGICNSSLQLVPTYRCLLKLSGIELDVKQSPVKMHKRFQHLMPAFTKIYNDVFAPIPRDMAEPSIFQQPTTSSAPVVNIPEVKMPAKLPQGLVHLSLDKATMLMAPLSSLSVTYSISFVSAQVETSHHISFKLGVGDQTLRFSPKEQYKDELSLRNLSLPTISLNGEVKSGRHNKLPKVSLELVVKQVNIDLTTDVLNQLLIVQNTFIKELNDLVQLFINIGESIPHKERLANIRQETIQESGTELISFLESCKLSLAEICVTVSTPLSTALRFSTGKIDMLVTNTSTHLPGPPSLSRSQLSLSGKVDIDISLALGYLQDLKADVVDDFCELAYFRTRIAVRNTQQNVRQSLIPGEEEQGGETAVVVDTFLISILSPHLYVQSTAIEQAILFWLNCKSVYSYWQNERKQLNAEVQRATEAIIEKIQRPTQLQTPSIDFSKPRLVQITVSDVGACMPLMPVSTTPHSTQKAFPALVITIKEMQLLLNLSHKVASTGNFSTFCMRFAEQFYLRHKTWTLDPKRHKFTNCGSVNHGTFRLCIATKKRYSETDPSVVLGEKLLWAFQWDMSGIDVNANTDIGRHTSTLLRTMTTIGTDLDGNKEKMKRARSGLNLPLAKPQRKATGTPRLAHHRRAMSLSVVRPHAGEEGYKEALEQDLARQTRKVQKMRHSGATGDSLKSEEETLRQVEQELARTVHKMFRRPRGISLHQLNQIFSPRLMKPAAVATEEKGMERRGSMRRRFSTVVRRQLFSLPSEPADTPIVEEEPSESVQRDEQGSSIENLPSSGTRPTTVAKSRRTHRRYKSDITGLQLSDSLSDERAASVSPTVERDSPLPSPTPTLTPKENPIFDPYESVSRSSSVLGRSASTPTGGPMSQEEEEEEERDFSLPSIDVEVNVTINVDYGIIILRNEESSERRRSIPLTMPFSSHLHPSSSEATFMGSPRLSRDSSKHPPSAIDSVLLIPALQVKVHYQSMVGSALPKMSTVPFPQKLTPHSSPIPPGKEQKAASSGGEEALLPEPQKKGVLSLSAIVASLPEDVEVTPSLLEFIEKVARPTLAATVVTSSNGNDSDSEEGKNVEDLVQFGNQPTSDSWPISFPVDVTLTFQIQPSTVHLSCQPHSRVRCMFQSPDVNFVISFTLFSKQQPESSFSSDSTPLLSQVTVVPFNNLYITGCLTTFALQLFSPVITSSLKSYSSTSKIENKEALSLTLGQALIHLSRKTVFVPSSASQGPPEKGTEGMDDQPIQNKLQVSIITNIASLVLGYDMRRLNDITAFRRYWYRTSLVEALFIGSKKKPSEGTPVGGQVPCDSNQAASSEDSLKEPSGRPAIDDSISAAIAVAATVDDFRISANVAQVMGNANLLVTHLKCEAHLDISRNELVLFNLDGRLVRGEVDARGGVIAGNVLVEDVLAHVTTDSQKGSIPVHKVSASMHLVEGRVDYMSSCIVLGRATCFRVQASDCWEGLQLGDPEEERPAAASICILADLTWENLQLAVHRSTTKSMFNIVQKMREFIVQQKRRGERTISIMLPAGSAASRALAAYHEEQKKAEEKKEEETTENHWLWAIRVGSVELMRTLGIHTPGEQLHDVSLGGKFTIAGENVCLVCFHGTSFRETEWAVFNIDLINASFSTQAIPGLGATYMNLESQAEEGLTRRKRIRTCQQICTLRLGTDMSRSAELAAVYRVSAGRSRVPPVTGTNVNDWLAYACIDYHLHPDKYVNVTAKLSALVKLSKKLNVQPVLLFPAFSVELINDHFWPLVTNGQQQLGATAQEPTPDELPLVECSFVSRFSEGISVTTTVNHYLFLHDLVKGYVEYLEKHQAGRSPFATPELTTTPGESRKLTGPPSRQFVCVCWELDPHLLLLTTVSGQFNPHINWLLETLGFTHARTTIPKWIQKGAMDPLDMVISSILELVVKLTASKKLQMNTASLARIDEP